MGPRSNKYHFDVFIANSEMKERMEQECVKARTETKLPLSAVPAFLNDSDLGTMQRFKHGDSSSCVLLKKRDSTGAFRRCPNMQKHGGGSFCVNDQK